MQTAKELIASYEPEEPNSMAFVKANDFLHRLHKYSKVIARQELSTLRGQALHGDIEGAERGLERILRRRGECDDGKKISGTGVLAGQKDREKMR